MLSRPLRELPPAFLWAINSLLPLGVRGPRWNRNRRLHPCRNLRPRNLPQLPFAPLPTQLQPLLDQLQGGGEGDNPLQPLVDQFESAAAGGEGGESDNPLQPVLDVLPIPAPSEGGDSDSEPSALPLSLAFSFESAAFSFSFGFDGQEPVFELPTP